MNKEGGSTLTIRKSNRVTDGFKGYKATLFVGEKSYTEINIPLRGGDDLFLHGLQLPGGQLRRLHLLPGQGVGLFLFLLAPGGLLRLLIWHLLLRGGSLFLRSLLRLFRRLQRLAPWLTTA